MSDRGASEYARLVSILRCLSDWWRSRRTRRRHRREAGRLLAALFADPERLRATSLRPEHRARAALLRPEVEGDEVVAVHFSILRHPRPHPFSRQFHEVIEYWRLPAEPGSSPVRLRGVNVSREKGGDGEPSGRAGPGV